MYYTKPVVSKTPMAKYMSIVSQKEQAYEKKINEFQSLKKQVRDTAHKSVSKLKYASNDDQV